MRFITWAYRVLYEDRQAFKWYEWTVDFRANTVIVGWNFIEIGFVKST